MIFGMCLRYVGSYDGAKKNIKKYALYTVGALIMFAFFHYLNGPANIGACYPGNSVFVLYILGILGFIIVCFISMLLARFKNANKFFSYLGQKSLCIMSLHMMFISVMQAAGEHFMGKEFAESNAAFLLCEGVIAIIGCVIFYEIVTRVFKGAKKYL